ncbi:hypothetical protein DAY19_14535 [Halobacteriovorax vibrionivorans]|uniref:Alpha/beta hydrolase fold-3 domain-containing protein n=1 Tax=Halobacteriovorax vibrionivorans TaxID=2152716 RepID=A0ABY0IG86_9BACT|nr:MULTISPECIES: alpha/beta hydrolase fold domain-containing protein [Halobacteriovorax]RZF20377.1 hypothetical protein DAY19_14535 [Halobacteriovorax vibrionivorans]TGD46550.1 hypothetical protein EP118_11295 [Halobacteriovorax sp. Y22]
MNETIRDFLTTKRLASMQAFFDAGIKRFSKITLEELRRAMAIVEKENTQYVEDEFSFDDRRILVWTKDKSKIEQECILHFHSGGYVTGDELTGAQFCQALYNESGRTILCPDYPLCPEVTIPEIVDWSLKLLLDLKKRGVKRFILTGTSAGANLVTLCALENAKRSDQLDIKEIHLITGHYQSDFDSDSAHRFESGEESGLSKSMLLKLLDYAISDRDIHLQDPDIFPLYSDDLSLLPRTNIYVAKYDVLYDDSIMFYEKLMREGVQVSFKEFSSGFHAWTNYVLECDELLNYAKNNIFNEILKDNK